MSEKLTAARIEEKISRDEVARHRGIRKYKRTKDDDREGGLKEGTEIFLGVRVVMRVTVRNDVKGYVLAEVIDFLDDNTMWWGRDNGVVVKVEVASQDQVKPLVGRYRTGSVASYGYWKHGYEIVAVGAKEWGKYTL